MYYNMPFSGKGMNGGADKVHGSLLCESSYNKFPVPPQTKFSGRAFLWLYDRRGCATASK
jgi:hypothetical protein